MRKSSQYHMYPVSHVVKSVSQRRKTTTTLVPTPAQDFVRRKKLYDEQVAQSYVTHVVGRDSPELQQSMSKKCWAFCGVCWELKAPTAFSKKMHDLGKTLVREEGWVAPATEAEFVALWEEKVGKKLRALFESEEGSTIISHEGFIICRVRHWAFMNARSYASNHRVPTADR